MVKTGKMDRKHDSADDFFQPRLVHCRVGSLEMLHEIGPLRPVVHCRVGSLEIRKCSERFEGVVHCRVGSLEMLHGRECG